MITNEDQAKALAALHGMSDAEQRRAAQCERDEASYAERWRAQRHHDVLCLVLKELVKDSLRPHTQRGVDHPEEAELNTRTARQYADLAYPPPKAEEP